MAEEKKDNSLLLIGGKPMGKDLYQYFYDYYPESVNEDLTLSEGEKQLLSKRIEEDLIKTKKDTQSLEQKPKVLTKTNQNIFQNKASIKNDQAAFINDLLITLLFGFASGMTLAIIIMLFI